MKDWLLVFDEICAKHRDRWALQLAHLGCQNHQILDSLRVMFKYNKVSLCNQSVTVYEIDNNVWGFVVNIPQDLVWFKRAAQYTHWLNNSYYLDVFFMPFLKKCRSTYPLHGIFIHKDHPETIFIVQENKKSKLLTGRLNVPISMFV